MLLRLSLCLTSSLGKGMCVTTWRILSGRREGRTLLFAIPDGKLSQTEGQGMHNVIWLQSVRHFCIHSFLYTIICQLFLFSCFFFSIGSIFSCPSLSNWMRWIQQYIFSASILNVLLLSDTIFWYLYIDYFPLIYFFLADIYQYSSEHDDQCKLLPVIRLF